MRSLRVLSFDSELSETVEVVVVYDGQPTSDWLAEVAEVQGVSLQQVSMAKAGPAAARNLAAQLSRSEQLIFCDSDVIITAEAVREAMGAAHGVLVVPSIEPIAKNSPVADFFSEFVFAPRHENGNDFTVSAFWGMTKTDFNAIDGFDERFRHPAGEDLDFMQRWNLSGRTLRFAPQTVVFHRNPTTTKELAKRAVRYGRHGDLMIGTAGPIGAFPDSGLGPPTILDLLLFPLALAAGGARRFFGFLETTLTSISLAARRTLLKSGHSWLNVPSVAYTPLRIVFHLVGTAVGVLVGRNGSRSHSNRRLTMIWQVSWKYGQLSKHAWLLGSQRKQRPKQGR